MFKVFLLLFFFFVLNADHLNITLQVHAMHFSLKMSAFYVFIYFGYFSTPAVLGGVIVTTPPYLSAAALFMHAKRKINAAGV